MSDPLTIEARPGSARERMRQKLRGRRIMFSGVLALLEVLAFIIWRPNALLLATLAVVVLVLSVMGATRVPRGLLRDILWIVAIAQAIVVAIPLVVGAGVLIGLITAVVMIVALVGVAARWRV